MPVAQIRAYREIYKQKVMGELGIMEENQAVCAALNRDEIMKRLNQ